MFSPIDTANNKPSVRSHTARSCIYAWTRLIYLHASEALNSPPPPLLLHFSPSILLFAMAGLCMIRLMQLFVNFSYSLLWTVRFNLGGNKVFSPLLVYLPFYPLALYSSAQYCCNYYSIVRSNFKMLGQCSLIEINSTDDITCYKINTFVGRNKNGLFYWKKRAFYVTAFSPKQGF